MSLWLSEQCGGDAFTETTLVFNEDGTGTIGGDEITWEEADGVVTFRPDARASSVYRGEFVDRDHMEGTFSLTGYCWQAERL